MCPGFLAAPIWCGLQRAKNIGCGRLWLSTEVALEDQLLKNLASLGLNNVEHAHRINRLNELLRQDYRGLIVSTIQKFRDMPARINERSNIYVRIDEAHRTTGGDLGTFLMAGLPNATFIGFTGTPVDKTAYGRGTFKAFGCED